MQNHVDQQAIIADAAADGGIIFAGFEDYAEAARAIWQEENENLPDALVVARFAERGWNSGAELEVALRALDAELRADPQLEEVRNLVHVPSEQARLAELLHELRYGDALAV